MKQIRQILTVLPIVSALLLSGCGVTNDDAPFRYTIKLSSLHYVKDANVTVEQTMASYRVLGAYDFTVEVSGIRTAVGGAYVTDENNESNTSAQSTLCMSYLPTLDTDASALTLSTPAMHGNYAYLNINPFTTLLAKSGMSKEEMAVQFPVAAAIEANFDFDVTAARKAYAYSTEESNLTKEICEALEDLKNL